MLLPGAAHVLLQGGWAIESRYGDLLKETSSRAVVVKTSNGLVCVDVALMVGEPVVRSNATGTQLAALCPDGPEHNVLMIFDLISNEVVPWPAREVGGRCWLEGLDWRGDAVVLTASHDNDRELLWAISTSARSALLLEHTPFHAFMSLDRTKAVTSKHHGDATTKILSVCNGRQLAALEGPHYIPPLSEMYWWSPDGLFLATGEAEVGNKSRDCKYNNLRIYSVATGCCLLSETYGMELTDIYWAPDSCSLVAAFDKPSCVRLLKFFTEM